MKKFLFAACLAASVIVQSDNSFLMEKDLWILSGDSITSTDTYRQILQTAINHYHPDSNISIGNRGVWGQKLSEEKTLEEKAQIISIMIAMNSFIHHEFGDQVDFSRIIDDHIKLLRERIREYKKNGTHVILMTPTLTDEREGGFFVTYNTRRGLIEVGKAIEALAKEEGCFVLPVAEELEEYMKRMGPYECFRPDGVHPYGYGQYVIANTFLRHLNFAGNLNQGRNLTAPKKIEPLDFKCTTRFLNSPEEKIKFASNGIKGRIRWSVWCDSPRVVKENDLAGHCMARGEGRLNGEREWTLPVCGDAISLKIGERARILIDIIPDCDKKSRLFCVDLANTVVFKMKDGKVSGEVTTTKKRSEGPQVATWEVREDGPDLWFTGKVKADSWNYKPYGSWGNVFKMNGLQVLFDFRPKERFAGVNTDRDAPMVLFSIVDNPEFSFMPFVWMARRYQASLFSYAKKCDGGYDWTLGFRGNITDCEAFDIRKLDYFGFYLIVADEEGKDIVRYAQMPYLPHDNPERRMNQMMIIDRKGVFPNKTTTTVNFFAF